MTKTKSRPRFRESVEGVVEARRKFLKGAAVMGGTAAAVGAAQTLGFPYIRDAEAAMTTTWKIQTSWPGGIGLDIFKNWCNSIVEKTGGELALTPFGAKDVVGDFQLFDAVQPHTRRVGIYREVYPSVLETIRIVVCHSDILSEVTVEQG